MIPTREIYITRFDLARLERMIRIARAGTERDTEYLDELAARLEEGSAMDSREVPRNVVTMSSQVRLRTEASAEPIVYTLVFPEEHDLEQRRISVLAPLGAALLGSREGDTIVWRGGGGTGQAVIEKILYQPEAVGDYHL